MEAPKERLKVYCETSFWSYLNGGRTSLQHIAVKQAATLQWWEEIAPSCDIYVSQFVCDEVMRGDEAFVRLRERSMFSATMLDGMVPVVEELTSALMRKHAVPITELTDASHIATAAVYGMDVLLTWNCRHMANEFTLPKTYGVLKESGFNSPVIITPKRYMEDIAHDE